MQTLEVVAKAGAIAISADELAVGTLTGVARYSYPSLSPLGTREGLFAEGCSGLQFAGKGLILLGSDVGQSFGKPADWKHSLVHFDRGEPRQRLGLGPGNWRLVTGLRGTGTVLYDVSEDQGIFGADIANGIQWSFPRTVHRVVSHGANELLALDQFSLCILSAETGRPLAEYTLPNAEEAAWTAVAALRGELILGGHTRDRSEYLLARWSPGAPPLVERISLNEVFTAEQIEAATCDEETCGADLFHVASIRVGRQGRLVVALGGDGESLGACQGACAIAVFDGASLARRSVQVVDSTDGASGMLLAADDGVLVDCCGSIHVLRPNELAG